MKISARVLFVVLAIMSFSSPAWAAIAFSQTGSNIAGNTTSVAVTVTVNASDTVVVVCTVDGAGVDCTAPTDNRSGGSNTYTQQGTTAKNGTKWLSVWSTSVGGAGAATTVTCNRAAGVSQDIGCAVATYTGASTLGTTQQNTGATTPDTVALTTQDNNNFVVGGFSDRGQASDTANTGNLRSSTFCACSADRITVTITDNTAASPSSVTNAVNASGNFTWVAMALELRAASAGKLFRAAGDLTGLGVGGPFFKGVD